MKRHERQKRGNGQQGGRLDIGDLQKTTMSHFRRGQSKVFYASDIWDPGEEARTSFRSSGSDEDEDNESRFLTSAALSTTATTTSKLRRPVGRGGGYVDEFEFDDALDVDDVDDEFRTFYAPPPVRPILGRPSVLNRSAELDDILEEETDDKEADGDDENEGSPSPVAISTPSPGSDSPEGSFRLPRGASVRRSQESNESSSSSSGETPVSPPTRKTVRSAKNGVSGGISTGNTGRVSSHKSHDSGFSDSGGSQNGDESKRSPSQSNHRDVRSQVVHETRSLPGSDGKPMHVSKIYFYAVNNTGTGSNSNTEDHLDNGGNHVSILDCETGRVRKGYAHGSSSPLLSPPLSPPPPPPLMTSSEPTSHNTSTESADLPKLDPLACDIDYYESFLINKPLPLVVPSPASSFTEPSSGLATPRSTAASTQTIVVSPKSTPSPRVHTGTSSLGRNKKKKADHETAPPSTSLLNQPMQNFPKTNGSLYESLSLGRPSSRNNSNSLNTTMTSHQQHQQRLYNSSNDLYRNVLDDAQQQQLSLLSTSVTSGLGSPFYNNNTKNASITSMPYDGFDDPLSGSRLSFRGSLSNLDMSLLRSSPFDGIKNPESSFKETQNLPSPVQLWLQELSSVHEAECTIMLQSKPIIISADAAGNSSQQQFSAAAALAAAAGAVETGGFWAGSSRDTIRAIQSKAHAISAVFVKLCKQLGHKGVTKLVPLVQGLSHQIHLFLVEYNRCNHLPTSLPGYKPRSPTGSGPGSPAVRAGVSGVPEEILHQERLLLQSCDRLKLVVSRHDVTGSGEMVDVIRQLGATLTKMIELMLSKEIKLSVETLISSSPETILRGSIDNVTSLALEGNHLCRLIAKHGGVRLLVKLCIDPNARPIRVNAFRALGTVCCVLEGIMELEDAGGIRVITDTLMDSDAREEEKSEAAGLLAQVTSPWIENNSSIEGLAEHLNNLVTSLTALSEATRSAETFLLSSAALANLTFMESSVVHLMKEKSTVPVLIGAVLRQQKNVSIYIQDQVAAVLANMAANADCRTEVVRHGGLPVLLQFLRTPLPVTAANKVKADWRPEDFAQMSATERVLQKSAIAISRLCNDPKLAEEVVRLDGLSRLVELCKNENARIGSDGVLVACLAAVRKIASVVGPDQLSRHDASELVEPRLLDSFLIFSSKNESFV